MTRRLVAIVLMGGLLALASPAHAQYPIGWLEGGWQASRFGSGVDKSGVAFGGGFIFAIGGAPGRTTGVLVPVGIEFKYNGGIDMVGTADIGIRVHAVSFGPGATFAWQMRSDLEDPRCLSGPLPVHSSCAPLTASAKGHRDMGGLVGMAPSGFVKFSFGPQGRAFVQGRYIYYPKGTVKFLGWSELGGILDIFSGMTAAGQAIQEATANDPKPETFHPIDYPEFDTGHDLRLSAGWAFGGANGGAAKMLRVQYSEKEFTFTPVRANVNGIFDQKTKTITVGIGAAW